MREAGGEKTSPPLLVAGISDGGAERSARARRSVSLALIALTLALAYGSWYAYSVFLVALLADFGWSRSILGGAFSVFALVQGTANPLLGSLCDRVRPPSMVAFGSVALGLSLYMNSYIQTPWHLYV